MSSQNFNDTPGLVEPTVLEVMMRKLDEHDNPFAFRLMLGVLADHGLAYRRHDGGTIVHASKVSANKVASLEGPGEDTPKSAPLKRPTRAEARVAADVSSCAEWACAVLDRGAWSYDRKGWRDVARIGANRIIDLIGYIALLESELKREET